MKNVASSTLRSAFIMFEREGLAHFPIRLVQLEAPRFPNNLQLLSMNSLIGSVFLLLIINGAAAAANADFHPSNLAWWGNGTDNWLIVWRYDVSTNCSGVPNTVIIGLGCNVSESEYQECTEGDVVGLGTAFEVPHAEYWLECVDDASTTLTKTFGDTPFLRIDYYDDSNCTEFSGISVYSGDNECHDSLSGDDLDDLSQTSWRLTLNENGSFTNYFYTGFNCTGDPTSEQLYASEDLESGECTDNVIASRNPTIDFPSGSASSEGSNQSDSSSGSTKMSTTGFVAATGIIALLVV